MGAGFFLFDLRAPLNLVMHLLPRVKQRRGFLVSAEDMPRAFQDLKMWSDLLSSELGERRFLVTPDGLFGVWRWQEGFGEGALPSGIFYAATDASKRAGGITFDGNRRVHDFKGDQVAGFWHINLLETAMGLQFVVQFGSQSALLTLVARRTKSLRAWRESLSCGAWSFLCSYTLSGFRL